IERMLKNDRAVTQKQALLVADIDQQVRVSFVEIVKRDAFDIAHGVGHRAIGARTVIGGVGEKDEGWFAQRGNLVASARQVPNATEGVLRWNEVKGGRYECGGSYRRCFCLRLVRRRRQRNVRARTRSIRWRAIMYAWRWRWTRMSAAMSTLITGPR